jgi:glycogen synthase kinase 3 beta
MDKEEKLVENDLLFDKKDIVGQGAFGEVFLAKIKKTGEKVAVKTVFQDRRYKNRELSIMQKLNHPNIVKLLAFYYTKANIPKAKSDDVFLNCIMDYVPETLSVLISKNKHNGTKFPSSLLKVYSYQMLKSIGYLHSIGICHRDIKPQNILIDLSDYTLKLCDFGCAKQLVKTEENIAYICSRYYRPPELVLGATFYTCQVDVWSIGCVIAELVLNRAIFPGKSAKEQMYEIIKILGTPTKEQINEMNPKVHISKLPNIAHKLWKDVFKDKTDDQLFIALVGKLLVYEPNKRLTPYQALNHLFFDDMKKKDFKFPNGNGLPKHTF